MSLRFNILLENTQHALRHLVTGPQALALLPGIILATFWLGGEPLLILSAILLPFCILIIGILPTSRSGRRTGDTAQDMLESTEMLITEMDAQLRQAKSKSLKTACLIVEIDDHDELTSRFGHAATQYLTESTFDRVRAAVRSRDKVFMLSGNSVAIAIAPVRQFDLDVGLQMAVRLQNTLEEPVKLDATTIYLSVSAGFCISSQLKNLSGKTLAHATTIALNEARANGPSAIRSYSTEMREPSPTPVIANDEVSLALENGQIQPWFQPQISTHTGKITGFEALARWIHPDRGVIPPGDFLPLLESSAQLERLGDVILHHSLNALSAWDLQSSEVPGVGVNFSPQELRNPNLLKKIEWELDRFNLTPDRLVIEILETVVATSPDDMVARNINGLSALGCKIDLDDFGTGHASISSIRRFAIGRLKIDRSFVMKVDKDPEQQKLVSAILLMAERLDLDTLAEGVETVGEHSMLAQLGCGHVQGFGIGRPMPFEKTMSWIADHSEKLEKQPVIGRKFG